ncbi:transmembrane protein 81 [Vanacampus margaritifer]
MNGMLALLFLMLHLQFSSADDNGDKLELLVAVNSTPCSVTCGMGFKVQTVCMFKDGEKAITNTTNAKSEVLSSNEELVNEDLEKCHDEKVKCRELWNCGIKTVTKTTGERLQLDCLVEMVKQVERLSWRVQWHRAPGVIISDNSFFARYESPQLVQLILDPIKEEHAGTYRCDVLDGSYRRLKRAYWGVRVLPRGVLNLDYDHAQSAWESPSDWNKDIDSSVESFTIWIYIMLIFLSLLNVVVLFVLLRMLKNRGTYKVPEDANSPETITQL